MAESTLLAIDQGTTSSRAILFSAAGKILKTSQKELKLIYPVKGWVEQDPEDIWRDVVSVCRDVMQDVKNCAAIGITNQRETTILWDRTTGNPVYNAIVWQDRRTADFCAQLKEQNHEKMITEKTGLLIDPYFSCTKIKWILDNVEGVRQKAEKGDLAFGTVDSFLLWRLTGGKMHATDATNASRTGLFNIRTQEWDKELLALYNVPHSLLPEVKDNVADFGVTDSTLFGQALPIGGMAGDQHAALIGQACFDQGMMKSTYGTGCFSLMNIGENFRVSKNKLLTTMAYRFKGQANYAVEGSIFTAGAAIQWLRDNLGVISKSSDSEKLALSVADNNGVYFVPAFTGLGAPHWRPEACAAITGLTRESSKAHIVRAALEAQAYQMLDLLQAMQADTGLYPECLRVDGGLVTNEFVCQFLADMLQVPVEVPAVTETTALGAAYLAGLSAGVYSDFNDLSKQWQRAKLYTPKMTITQRDGLYNSWNKALESVIAGSGR